MDVDEMVWILPNTDANDNSNNNTNNTGYGANATPRSLSPPLFALAFYKPAN